MLATALMLGFLHALEVDHMIAVTTFVSTRPAIRSAARFGVRWGLGHSLAVLGFGVALLATGLRWPERYDAIGEAIVGVMLVGLGAWAIVASRKLHLHRPEEHGGHAHLHVHPRPAATHDGHAHPHDEHHPAARHHHHHAHPHRHGHGITLVGLMHGLAGTTAVVALVPVAMIDRLWWGVAYLVAFGVGVTAAMALYAVLAALAMGRAAEHSLTWGRRIAALIGIAGMLVGTSWIWSAVRG